MKDNLTCSALHELFEYNPRTGVITNKISRSVAIAGTEAGYVNEKGYRMISLNGLNYRAHRVIWTMVTGLWPREYLDHINGKTDDNRLSNLREVSHSENHRNRKLQKNNTSGFQGVCWNIKSKRWRSSITVKGRLIHLGTFDSTEEAAAARAEAEVKYGFHENHGRSG